MIVTSTNLALELIAEYSQDNPVFGWHDLIADGLITADYTADGYPESNLANPATNLIWRSSDNGEQYVEFFFDTTEEVDYLAIAGHNFYSSGRSISIEYAADDESPTTWEELIPEMMPSSDDAIIFRFERTGITGIRIKMFATSGAVPEMAVVYCGRLLQMERSFPETHNPITKSPVTDTVTGESDGGHFLGSIVRKQSLASSIPFQMLNEEWYDENMQPFIDYANMRNPFFFAWMPYSRPNETGYSWLTADASPTYKPQIGTVDISLQMNAVR